MSEIVAMRKPDWVSWDTIHEVLDNAHKVNKKRGFEMINSHLTGEQIKKKVGDGICVVALDGDKVVATQSVSVFKGDRWYSKGKKVAHFCLTGIMKRYQGCGIKEMLDKVCDEFVAEIKPDIIQANTAEDNIVVLKGAAARGNIILAYEVFRKTDYYTVFFARWPQGRPYPLWYCRLRCKLSEWYIKTRYKPGKIERFKTIAFVTRVINKTKSLFHK